MEKKEKRKQHGRKLIEDVMATHYKDGLSLVKTAEHYRLTRKQVVAIINREHRRNKRIEEGIAIKNKGRPRTKPLTTVEELKRRNQELEMEVDLLKKFHEELRR